MKKIIFLNLFFLFASVLFAQDATTPNTSGNTTPAVQQAVPATPAVRKKNGWDYYSEGNYHASIRSLEEERKLFPGRINIYIILGWNYKALKDYPEMERISIEGYNINPIHVNILKNLGEACYFQNKYSDSIKYFEKYAKIKNKWQDPYTYSMYYYLGDSYYNIGAYYKADTALSAANILKPNNVQNLLLLGKVNEKLKNYKQAMKHYEALLKLEPANMEARNAYEQLKKTQSNDS